MEKNTRNKIGVIILSVTSLLILTLLFATLFAISDSYKTEQETINTAFSSLNLQHPTYNETTRFFETQENGNVYVGYIEFNTTETSTIKIKQFTNYTNTLIIGSRVLYVSDNNTIIYQKNVNRRFN